MLGIGLALARPNQIETPIRNAAQVSCVSSIAPKLLVFLHVAVKQRAFQGELQAALGGIDVTAVGRIGDFDRALQDGPDAVLTLPVVHSARGLSASLHGRRQGATDETYALVGADSAPDPAKIQSVGALDLLGRDGTDAFVTRIVRARPKVERVTKVEDLLPLLQMQRVDAILLATRFVSELRKASRMSLTQRELATRVELAAAANLGPGGAQILGALSRLPAQLSNAMGVDEWR
jgi:hypothetical protein